jgi:hypothetical protein
MAPAGGGAWQHDLDQFATKPSGGSNFQADLDKLGGGPRQPNPMTDDFQRDLDRLGAPQGNFQRDFDALGIKPVAAATAPAAAPSAPPDTEWSALPSHILPSAGQFLGNIGHALLHPIQTAETVGDIGLGALEKLGISPTTGHEQYAQAFGQMLADRYGGLDRIKETAINDPVGLAADLSAVFGGAGALARGAGMAGAADVAATASRLANPLSAAGVPLRVAGRGASEIIGGLTHTGGRPLQEAAAAGYEGGSTARAFREQITGRGPMEAPVTDVERALDNLVADQKSKYAQDMQRLGLNRRQLSLADTFQAVQNSKYLGGFGTTMSANPITQTTWNAVNDTVQQWALKGAQDPSYMTPIGLDGLKRQIGKLGPHTGESGAIIAQVQKALRSTITQGAPEYIGYMQTFERASDIIGELRKTFSIPVGSRGPAVDTQLRKLQSILRDNVNTSYGYRAKLAEYLTDEAPDLMARLAGQALQPWAPRGLGKLAFSLGAEAAAALLGTGTLSGGTLGLAALAPFMSPRLMGNAAYRLGQTGRLGQYAPYAFQAGRADEAMPGG